MIRPIERRLSRIANRRGLSLSVVGLTALASSAVPYLYYSNPLRPFSSWSFFSAYDEFSYLLAADTYAAGRLTNPTHEMWPHFVTQTVLHQPTYQSIYPPGQGAFLAVGKALTGHPIVGVWISMLLASVATFYLLRAWFAPRWALWGGLLSALHARMALEWGGTYWGGAVAMLGGALVFGGLRQILKSPRIRDAILFGVGLALLANSRPFEGFVASVPALVVLAGWLGLDGRFPLRTRLTRVVLPLLAVVAASAAGMSYYNFRVTGSPWTLPYQAYLATQGGERPFVWQIEDSGREGDSAFSEENGAPEADHAIADTVSGAPPAMAGDQWWVAEAYLKLLTHPSTIVSSSFKVAVQWGFYLGPVLTLPLLAIPRAARKPWTWFVVGTIVLTQLAVLATTGAYPHYLAPVAPLIIVLVVLLSRYLGLWKRGGRRIGRYWVTAVSALWLLQLLILTALFPRLTGSLRWAEPRARLQARLEETSGDHLVMVRYSPGHIFYQEWVYNESDIDGARVVWARELSPDSNRRLLDYFRGRRVWLVEPDRDPSRLVPYAER